MRRQGDIELATATTGPFAARQPNLSHGPSQVQGSSSPKNSSILQREYNPLLQSGSMRVLPLVANQKNPDPNAQNSQNRPHLVASQNGQVFPIPNPLQSIQSNSLLSTSARLVLHERVMQQSESSSCAVPSAVPSSYANTASIAISSMLSTPSASLAQSISTSVNMLGLAGALPLPVLTALDPSSSSPSKGRVMPKTQGLATTDSDTQSKSNPNLVKQISPSLNQPQALPTASVNHQVSGIPCSPACKKRVQQTAVIETVISPLS